MFLAVTKAIRLQDTLFTPYESHYIRWAIEDPRAGTQSAMSKNLKLILIVIALFMAAMVIASMLWHGDNLYKGAYAPMVEKSQLRQQEGRQSNGDEHSDQPQAPGFKEKDIDRQHGDGFSTY